MPPSAVALVSQEAVRHMDSCGLDDRPDSLLGQHRCRCGAVSSELHGVMVTVTLRVTLPYRSTPSAGS